MLTNQPCIWVAIIKGSVTDVDSRKFDNYHSYSFHITAYHSYLLIPSVSFSSVSLANLNSAGRCFSKFSYNSWNMHVFNIECDMNSNMDIGHLRGEMQSGKHYMCTVFNIDIDMKTMTKI